MSSLIYVYRQNQILQSQRLIFALADIRQGSVGDVPDHLRDAHYLEPKIKPWHWLSIPT